MIACPVGCVGEGKGKVVPQARCRGTTTRTSWTETGEVLCTVGKPDAFTHDGMLDPFLNLGGCRPRGTRKRTNVQVQLVALARGAALGPARICVADFGPLT